jgi:hypothetical protein
VLAIPGLRAALRRCPAPVVAISPVIGGRAVKGPTAKLMTELGVEVSPGSIARHYAGGSTRICGDDRFERLQTRNYYIYTLTNVYSTWWHNCIDAFHLLLVRLKAGIFLGEIAIWTELKVFRATLMDWRIIRRKWLRDRAGTHPPSLQGIAMPVNVVVIGGTGVVT